MQKNMQNLEKCKLSIEGIPCPSCVTPIEKNIAQLPGVHRINVVFMFLYANVIYDPNVTRAAAIAQAITVLGYPSSVIEDSAIHKEKSSHGKNAVLTSDQDRLLKRLCHADEIAKWRTSFIISLLFGIPTMLVMVYFHWILKTPTHPEHQIPIFVPALSADNLILFVLATPAQFFAGRNFYTQSWLAIRRKTANMDVLVTLAISISYAYSVAIILVAILRGWPFSPMTFFDVPPMLIMFISLGRWLEYKAKAKTSQELCDLIWLQPKTAILVTRDENRQILSELEIDTELVQQGDLIKMKAGETIPVDGIVVEGHSSVNESFITGEPCPIRKTPNSRVIGGTINLSGLLIIRATTLGQNSLLAQIIRIVEEAQSSKVYHCKKQLTKLFVSMIAALSWLTFTLWLSIGYFNSNLSSKLDMGLGIYNSSHSHSNSTTAATQTVLINPAAEWEYILCQAVEYAITVLAIACPFSLATPTAIMVGTGVGARNGILIKGGGPMEQAQKINTVIFGKTGTITEGRPRVIRFYATLPANQLSFRRLLMLLGCAESNSEHPIGAAIVSFAKQFLKTDLSAVVSNFHVCPGSGIVCQVSGLTSVINESLAKIEEEEWSNTFVEFDRIPLPTNKGPIKQFGFKNISVNTFLKNGLWAAVRKESGLTSAINETLAKLEKEEWASSHVEVDRLPLPNNIGPIKQFGFKNISLNKHIDSKVQDLNALDSCTVAIGTEQWMAENGIPIDNAQIFEQLANERREGNIAVCCAINGQMAAVVSIADEVKPEAALAIWALQHKMGLNVALLTGDNAKTAEVIAKKVGIREVFAEVLPDQKMNKIRQLQSEGQLVAFVGNGSNDGPALAAADVGIAIGHGSDLAIHENAGIVLVQNNLVDVVGAIQLSKAVMRRIRHNLFFAFVYNAICIPLAAGVLAHWGVSIQPWMAAAAMAISSLLMVGSSLLLRNFKKTTQVSLASSAEFTQYQEELPNQTVRVYKGLPANEKMDNWDVEVKTASKQKKNPRYPRHSEDKAAFMPFHDSYLEFGNTFMLSY